MKNSLFYSVIGTLLMLALLATFFSCGGPGTSPIPPSLSQQAYIKASNTDSGDQFGFSVAVSGDTLAAGAWVEDINVTGINGSTSDNTATSSGAAYVYACDAGTAWSHDCYVKASNTDAGDCFGYDVDVDGGTLVVGAIGEDSASIGVDGSQSDDSAGNAGAVYVFVCDGGGNWSQQAYVKASNSDAYDLFGSSVSVSGDTLAVGAPQEDSSATGVDNDEQSNGALDAGAVYVFTRDAGGTWSQQAYIKASNTESGDWFGYCVALSGDTLAVGAPYEGDPATGTGAVYVFVRDGGGTWSQQAYIKASNADYNDAFGTSVALQGDTLAVGAPVEGSTATGVNGDQSIDTAGWAGAVYVFVRDGGGTWSQQAYVKASNTEAFDEFGTSVALHGDTLAVGAPLEDSAAAGVNGNQTDDPDANFDSGAVYVFTRSGVTWSQQAYVKASNTDGGDHFGTSVAVGSDSLVVGACYEHSAATGVNGNQADNSAIQAGAAYVFH